MLLLSAILVLYINNVRFIHIAESSLGLTIGSLLARLIGRTCDRQCGGAEVQQIPVNLPRQEEPEEEHEVSDSGDSVLIPNYDKLPAQQENIHL